jgi:hypothetical protein
MRRLACHDKDLESGIREEDRQNFSHLIALG